MDGDLFSATLVSVLAYAGLRPGEALALERRHARGPAQARDMGRFAPRAGR